MQSLPGTAEKESPEQVQVHHSGGKSSAFVASHHKVLLSGTLLFILGTFTFAQDPICYNITSFANFTSQPCCYDASNTCTDNEFCLGVALSASDTDLTCCEAYPSCQGANDMFRTLSVIKGLSIGDLVVSSLIVIFTLIKACFIIRRGDEGQAYIIGFSCLTIVLEVVDLALEVTIIAIVTANGSRAFVSDLLDAGCFNSLHDTKALVRVEDLFDQYIDVAIAEAVLDFIAINVHLFEILKLRQKEQEAGKLACAATVLGAGLDFAELVLASINFVVIAQIISDAESLHDSLTRSPLVARSGACIFSCCVPALLANSPTTSTSTGTQPPAVSPTVVPIFSPTSLMPSTASAEPIAPPTPPSSTPSPLPRPTPTYRPTSLPAANPTLPPTMPPATQSPTSAPVPSPTEPPTARPTPSPTERPTLPPTRRPTLSPTQPPTSLPTQAPTPSQTLALQALTSFLSSVSFDGGTALQTTGTPQNDALLWLANDGNLNTYSDDRTIQRYVLATIYYSLRGDAWTNNYKWLDGGDECEWWQDSVYSSSIPHCANDGKVIRLDLNRNNLVGSLPPEIGLLSSSLVYLRLYENSLRGSLPTRLGELTKLSSLALCCNSLMGTIPTELGLLTNLEGLVLWRNSLTGSIPNELDKLTKLMSLALGENSLRDTIPTELRLLTNLVELYLWENELTGSIPNELGDLTKLTSLWLSDNKLTGRVPSTFNQLSNLDALWLYNNMLTGPYTCPEYIEQCLASCGGTTAVACRSLP